MDSSKRLLKDTYRDWTLWLQSVAFNGQLADAIQQAFKLEQNSHQLISLIERLAEGQPADIPPIELLPSKAMPGIMGAYAISTKTIYLNNDWLSSTSKDELHAVLTEEFGHHLDQLISKGDTHGDEGKVFANRLLSNNKQHQDHNWQAIRHDDSRHILIDNKWIRVEAAVLGPTAGSNFITGTNKSDTITDDDNNRTIHGGGGADTIDGKGGADKILGQLGKDIIYGGLGNDSIYGQDGADQIWGDDPNDTVNGGNDTIEGNQGKDTIKGGAGNDSISGGDASSNQMYGGNGNDLIQSFGFNSSASDDNSKDTIYGEEGTDTLKGGNGRDKIYGGDDNDFLQGNGNWDSLYGGEGNDTINGNRGADWIWGDEGDDILRGFSSSSGTDNGSNRIEGGSGNDTITGANKRDSLHGGSGNDSLRGQAHADKLFGNGGDDILHGGKSYDHLFGGTGADIYHFKEPHKAHVHKDAIHQRHGHSVLYTSQSLISSNTLQSGGSLTFNNGVDIAIYDVGAATNKFWGRNRNGAGAGIFLPGASTLELLNAGDSSNNLTPFGNYIIRGSWAPSSGDLSSITLSDRIGSFTQNDTGEDVVLLYNIVNKDFISSENTNYLVVTDAFKNGTDLISAVIESNDAVAPSTADDSTSVERTSTSNALNLLDNDSDSDDSSRWISDDAYNKHLRIQSVGGVNFQSLSDSTDSTFTAANGYKQISGDHGTLFLTGSGQTFYQSNTSIGTETFTYTATDPSNNTSNAATLTISITDSTAPAITSISSSKPDGTYTTGDAIAIDVVFSEAVDVDTTAGTPTLTLETGDNDRNASYSSGSGTNTLSFTYTVQDGDTSSDLNYKATTSLSLNGATIQDAIGNNAALDLPALASSNALAGSKNLAIDTTAPLITGPSGGTGATNSAQSSMEGGTTVTQFSASEPVTWSLEPTFDHNVFTIDANGNLSFKSASDFESPKDTDLDNNYIVDVRALDIAQNQSTQRLNLEITDTDDTGPSVTKISSTKANGEHGIDSNIAITIEFSEIVVVETSEGTPSLILETGTNDQEILYHSGTNTNTLTFNYTVSSGDQSNDLDIQSTTAFATNGGTIRDETGNDADLTLAAPGEANSLSSNKELKIDGIAPLLSKPEPIDLFENALNNHLLHDFNDISGDDTDQSEDSLTYTIESGNDNNIFGIGNSNGQLFIQDNTTLDYKTSGGKYSLTIQASDGVNTHSVETVINVIDVNSSPVAINDEISLNENGTADQASAANGILSNDTDADNDTLTIEKFRSGLETGSGIFGTIGSAREGTYGNLTLNGDGTYSYIANLGNAEALAANVIATDAFTYWISDSKAGDIGQITFNVTGVNDAPHIVDAIAKKKYTEGQGEVIIIDSSLTVTDVDDSLMESATVSISSGYQSSEDILAIANTSEISGSWDAGNGQLTLTGSATKDAYAAALATVTYTNSDDLNPVLGHREISWQLNDGTANSNSATSIVDVGGVNDSPESTDDTASLNAGAQINITSLSGLRSNDSDPESTRDLLSISAIRTGREYESGSSGSIGAALTGTYGTLTVSTDGSYLYSANTAAADALAEGVTGVDYFTYTLSDGIDTDTGQLSINVTGTNNAPAGENDSKEVNENASIEVSQTSGVLINDIDIDGDDLIITDVQNASGSARLRFKKGTPKQARQQSNRTAPRLRATEASSRALPALTGTYGQLTLNSDGSYSYEANQTAANALNEGDMATDVFTYTLSDNKTTSTATLEIVVYGINDLPYIAPLSAGSIQEIKASTDTQTTGLTGTISATDADSDASLEFGILGGAITDSIASLEGNYGTLEVDTTTGDYTYTPINSNIEALKAGDSVTDSFKISATDSMALAKTDFLVNITGASESNNNSENNQNNDNNATNNDTSNIDIDDLSITSSSTPCELISTTKTKLTGLQIDGSPCPDEIKGTQFDDVLHGRRGHDTLISGKGRDTINGGQGNDRLIGRAMGDQLRGGIGNDSLHGGSGQDTLRGGLGDDILRGGPGRDTLNGRRGDDVLHGGNNADKFRLSQGKDKITDFRPKEGDQIMSKPQYTLTALERNGSVVLQDSESDIHTLLKGITLDSLITSQPDLF